MEFSQDDLPRIWNPWASGRTQSRFDGGTLTVGRIGDLVWPPKLDPVRRTKDRR